MCPATFISELLIEREDRLILQGLYIAIACGSPCPTLYQGTVRLGYRCVAPNAGTNTEPYNYIPFFYSREFNLSWQFYGQLAADGKTIRIITWGDMSPATAAAAAGPNGQAAKFGAYWVADGQVIGAFIEGPEAEESAALKALAAAKPAAPADLDVLKQQGIGWALEAKKLSDAKSGMAHVAAN